MRILAVCGWEKFQHYKDRDPPWVKLYRDLLSSESWVLGTDTSRLVQIASILLAARYSNKIPYQWTLIRKVSSLDCSEKQFEAAVEHLASHYFLEVQVIANDASEVLALEASGTLATCTSEAEKRQSRDRGRGREDRPNGSDLQLHMSLPQESWQDWLDYRREQRLPLTARALSKHLALLSRFTTEEQRSMIDLSINNTWRGLFPPRGQGATQKPHTPAMTTAEAEALEAARGR